MALLPHALPSPFLPLLPFALARSTHFRPRSPLPGFLPTRAHLACVPQVGRADRWRDCCESLAALPQGLSRISALISSLTTDSARVQIDPLPTHHYVSLLLSLSPPRPLEAAKLLLNLSRRAAAGTYKDPEGKSAYQLLGEWLEVCEKYPEETGVEQEESTRLRQEQESAEGAEGKQEQNGEDGAVVLAPTKRGDKNTPAASKASEAATAAAKQASYAPSTVDPLNPELLDVEGIVRNEGLATYKDQAGRLWTGLATYWIKRGEFDLARETFEEGIKTVVTLRDFTQIFDAYAEFSESYISSLMESVAEEADEDDEKELDERMKGFEELMDRRPFLVNEVLLRRNPNDVQEWEKRVVLYGEDDEKVSFDLASCAESLADSASSSGRFHLHASYAHNRPSQVDGAVPSPLDPLCQVLRAGRRHRRGGEGPCKRPEGVREGGAGALQESGGAGRVVVRVVRDGGSERVSRRVRSSGGTSSSSRR